MELIILIASFFSCLCYPARCFAVKEIDYFSYKMTDSPIRLPTTHPYRNDENKLFLVHTNLMEVSLKSFTILLHQILSLDVTHLNPRILC